MKNIGRKLFYSLPPALRFTARRLFYLPVDTWEMLLKNKDELMPPKGMIYTGSGDFIKMGKIQLDYFQKYCGLKSDGAVLDIGSGIGRSAIPLTGYLNKNGKYEGFDVVKRGVDWCRKNITDQYPNFNFKYIPLNNDLYRSEGKDPEKFQFPYSDNSFDLIIVNSVFTHMVANEVKNYFYEMSRVLKKGGRAYTTFFIFDKNKEEKFPDGFNFPFEYGDYRLMDDKVKSANVAFDKNYLKNDLAEKNSFHIRHLFYGSWKGLPRKECKEFQDIVIIEKKG